MIVDALVVVGSINVDLTIRVRQHPEPGETVLGADFTTRFGGKGANQAMAAAHAGCLVAMIAAVGSDAYGDEALTALRAAGVDVTGVERTYDRTGVALITVDDRGENTIVVDAGANAGLASADVLSALAEASPATTVLTQLEVPLEAVSAAAQRATAAGARFVLNPSPMRDLSANLLAVCDPLIVNHGEAQALVGHPIDSVENALRAARAMAGRSRSVVITLGPWGAVGTTAGRSWHVPGRQVKVVDSTGAGDVFAGTMSASLHAGAPLPDALEAAVAAASQAVSWPGAQAPHATP